MDIGSTIRTIRTNHGLSQDQMAELFHVTRQTVSNWENNRHYPDLSTLIKISEEFGLSLDEIVKSDEAFVAEVDNNKKQLSKLQRIVKIVIMISFAIILAMSGLFILFYYANLPTSDAKRVTTDTDAKMIVSLPGMKSTPSRAITRTYSGDKWKSFSDVKKNQERIETSGRNEGDIPCVYTRTRDEGDIVFVFQDGNYNNFEPEIIYIKIFRYSWPPQEKVEERNIQLQSAYKDGALVINAQDFADSNLLNQGEMDNAIFEIQYRYDGELYVSLTAINVFYDDHIDWGAEE